MKQRSFFLSLLGRLLLYLFVFRDGLWGGSLLAPLDVLSNPTFTSLETSKETRYLVLRYRPAYLWPSVTISIGAMLLDGGTLVARIGSRHQTTGTLDRG